MQQTESALSTFASCNCQADASSSAARYLGRREASCEDEVQRDRQGSRDLEERHIRTVLHLIGKAACRSAAKRMQLGPPSLQAKRTLMCRQKRYESCFFPGLMQPATHCYCFNSQSRNGNSAGVLCTIVRDILSIQYSSPILCNLATCTSEIGASQHLLN